MRIAREEQARREQRDLEMQVLSVIKKPVEDMELTDSKPLPDLPRFQNCGVTEDTFADVLMVVEFLHAFGEILKIENIPTVNRYLLIASLYHVSSPPQSYYDVLLVRC